MILPNFLNLLLFYILIIQTTRAISVTYFRGCLHMKCHPETQLFLSMMKFPYYFQDFLSEWNFILGWTHPCQKDRDEMKFYNEHVSFFKILMYLLNTLFRFIMYKHNIMKVTTQRANIGPLDVPLQCPQKITWSSYFTISGTCRSHERLDLTLQGRQCVVTCICNPVTLET